MLIGAVGDIHGRRYVDLLMRSLENLPEIDLLLLAGDVSNRNNLDSFGESFRLLRGATDAPIVAVFGNEEYDQSYGEYRKRFPLIFLDDEFVTMDLEFKTKIVGTTGSLDRPTWWQRTHLPDIWRVYGERVEKISQLLRREEGGLLLLLSHYPPTYRTLGGEKEGRHAEMGSGRLEEVVIERSPDLVVHGHAHRGRVEATLHQRQTDLLSFGEHAKSVPVFNVALPLVEGVTVLEVRERENGFHISRE